MPDDSANFDQADNGNREASSSNHLIWGMTAGLLIGTAIGFLTIDNVTIGVAIGIVIGAVLAMLLKDRVP